MCKYMRIVVIKLVKINWAEKTSYYEKILYTTMNIIHSGKLNYII